MPYSMRYWSDTRAERVGLADTGGAADAEGTISADSSSFMYQQSLSKASSVSIKSELQLPTEADVKRQESLRGSQLSGSMQDPESGDIVVSARPKALGWLGSWGTGSRVRPLLSSVDYASQVFEGAVASRGGAGLERRLQERVRNPYRRRFVVVFCALAISVALSLAQEVLLGVGVFDCRRENMQQDECAQTQMIFISAPLLLRQVICLAAAIYTLIAHITSIRVCRKVVMEGRKMTGAAMTPARTGIVAGHWTAVASSDTFAEVAAVVADNQLLALGLCGTATVLATVALVRLQTTEWEGSNPDKIRRITALCCDEGTEQWSAESCSEGCRAGALGHIAFLTFVSGMICLLICSAAFIPAKIWSPVTVEAAASGGAPHLRRMLSVPTATAVICALDIVLFLIYAVDFVTSVSIPGYWIAVLVLDLALALSHIGIVLATLGWLSLMAVPKWAGASAARLLKSASMASQLSQFSSEDEGSVQRIGHKTAYLWECRHSWRYKQLVLGMCGMFAFAVDAIGATRSTSAQELWIIRIIILLLMIFSRDMEADFDTLEEEGAGFGLVLDARQLCKALKCRLAGRRYKGRVKRYKGTLLRMCDTMAVSYRWQDTTVVLGGLGDVNMSHWQMQSLVSAIRSSGCLYVWLDAFSVPQMGGELKRLLLARMMAVYASSFVTVALLSCESENERYHQRVWTLQEYCSSGQLIVMEQPVDETRPEKTAVNNKEEGMVQRLRHEHMVRQPWCVPVWLHADITAMMGDMPAEDCVHIWETYKRLREQLHSLYPEDTIRALYPLLWNRPAESQHELIRLMEVLEQVHGIPQSDQIDLLISKSERSLALRFPSTPLLPVLSSDEED